MESSPKSTDRLIEIELLDRFARHPASAMLDREIQTIQEEQWADR
jgi:hypothetical protein